MYGKQWAKCIVFSLMFWILLGKAFLYIFSIFLFIFLVLKLWSILKEERKQIEEEHKRKEAERWEKETKEEREWRRELRKEEVRKRRKREHWKQLSKEERKEILWKQKYYLDKNGYIRDKNDDRLVSRNVAYEGIYLRYEHMYPLRFREYDVHHINTDKKDNKVANLILLTREEHNAVHDYQKKNLVKFKTRKEIRKFLKKNNNQNK